jgi:hypothetical protein
MEALLGAELTMIRNPPESVGGSVGRSINDRAFSRAWHHLTTGSTNGSNGSLTVGAAAALLRWNTPTELEPGLTSPSKRSPKKKAEA